jgi:hypothetical protein
MLMALIYRAELSPSKLELIADRVRGSVWFAGDPEAPLVSVASYRFDDPEGEVGIETLLVRAGNGPILQIPLTYRGAPLDGAEDSLIGTMHHSVLGKRWTYDATGDPAYIAAVAFAALTGGRQAEQFVDMDGALELREPTAVVQGSGTDGAPTPNLPSLASIMSVDRKTTTLVEADGVSFVLARTIGVAGSLTAPESDPDEAVDAAAAVLSGSWVDYPASEILAVVSRR